MILYLLVPKITKHSILMKKIFDLCQELKIMAGCRWQCTSYLSSRSFLAQILQVTVCILVFNGIFLAFCLNSNLN